MKINTKYNIGDHVYYLEKGKVADGIIGKIKIVAEKDEVRIGYEMKYEGDTWMRLMIWGDGNFINGDNLFNSKEELIASL